MNNIHFPTSKFDFNELSLAQPHSLQGGAFFTKLLKKKEPFIFKYRLVKPNKGW